LPSFYLARRIFSLSSEATPEQMLQAFYVGEGLKIGLTVGLFIIALLALDVVILWVIGGYSATVVVYWFAILMPEPVLTKQ
jgi:ATP synthase protein I